VLGRPISFYYPTAPTGCGASNCAREILLIGTPIEYWAFVPALIWLLWHWATTRDWRAGTVWMAFLAGWAVWLQDIRRTAFLFYMTPLMPFLVLGVTLAIGLMVSSATEDSMASGMFRGLRRDTPSKMHASETLNNDDEQVREVGLREWIFLRGISVPRLMRTGAVALWLGAVVADFIWMWPIFTGGLLTYGQWLQRMWFPSWI
jgi:dolichyl-phosphate-mannose-protein mannosyltransferase